METERRNVFSLLIGIIDQPYRTLRYISIHPRWLWLIPAILLIAGLALEVAISAPLTAELSAQEMQRMSLQMTEEQREMMTNMASPTMIAVSGIAFGAITMIIAWLFRSAVLHFATVTVGSDGKFSAMFSVVLWTQLPFFLGNLTRVAYVLINNRLVAHNGLSFLATTGDRIANARNLLYIFLARIDLFLLWHLFLLVMGVAAVTHFSRRKSTGVVLAYWVLETLIILGLSALSTRFIPS